MVEIVTALAKFFGVSVLQMYSMLGITIAGVFTPPILDIINNSKKKSSDNNFAKRSDIEHLLEADGMQLSKNISISAKHLFEHLVIFGPTGSGKSSSLFAPNLLQDTSFCNSQSSLIITDLKGELYDLTAPYQRSLGRNIKVFAPFNNDLNSIHYNPLDFCQDESDVIALAKDILVTGAKSIELRNCSSNVGGKDSVWINMASPLFAALLLYVYKLPRPKNTISYAIRLLLKKNESDLEKLILNSNSDNAILQYQMYQRASSSGPTTSSIQVTLTANVQSFLNPKLEAITAYSDFNFKELRENKTALYIIYPPDKSFDLASITSIFFSQLFNKCKDYNSEKHFPVFCLYDEFSNAGQIPLFHVYSSILRSYRIALICCMQDKNQLKSLYGEASETIFNNLRSLCIFGGEKDYQTLNSVQMLCGNREVINITTTKNDKGNTTTTKSFKSQPLMPVSEIKNISEDEILIMLKNQRPILDKINSYYKNYRYLNNSL